MTSSMGFNIFAKDVNASRTFDSVGDSAERLERRLDGIGKATSGLRGSFGGLTSGLSGLGGRLAGLAGSAASMGVSLVTSAGKLATLGASAASAGSQIVGLVGALAPAAGAIAAIPAAAVLGAGALATLKVAVSGVSEAFGAALADDPKKYAEALEQLSPAARAVTEELRVLKPAFDDLKSTVQDALFAPLQGQLTGLVEALNGPLKSGMSGLAGEFGRLGASVAQFGQSSAAIGLVEGAFATLRAQVGDLESGTMQRLLAAIANFTASTLPAFSGLGASVNGLAERFTRFLEAATASGKSLEWVQGAFAVFKQLGAILADVGGIFGAMFRAMQTAGTGTLGVIGELLDGVHAFLDSAKGQETLVTLFKAMSSIGQALLPVVTALGGALAVVAPIIAQLAQLIGPILTTAVQALAPALAALGPGLVAVFTELGKAVGQLAASGALTQIGQGLAALLAAVAPLLPPLAQLIGPLLGGLATLVTTYVAPALTTLVGWIKQAVDSLSGAGLSEDSWLMRVIRQIYDSAMPVWKQIGDLIGTVFTDIVAWFNENQSTVEAWGEKVISIVKTFGEVASGIWEFISLAWDTFGGPLLDTIGNVFTGILGVIDGVLTAIQGIFDVVLGVLTGDWERAWTGVKTFFSGIWDAIVAIVGTVIESMKIQLGVFVDDVDAKWDAGWTAIKNFFVGIWDSIVAWVKARVQDVLNAVAFFQELPGKVSAWFGQVKDSIVNRFNDAVAFVRGIPGQILNALGNLNSLLYNAGRNIVQGLIDGLRSMIGSLVGTVESALAEIRNRLPFSPAKEGPFSGKGWTLYSGRSMATDLAKGLSQGERLVARAADGLMGAASMSLTPTLAVGGADGMVPLAAHGGTTIINLNLAGQPLVAKDELYRLLIGALNEARGRGFNLGFVP